MWIYAVEKCEEMWIYVVANVKKYAVGAMFQSIQLYFTDYEPCLMSPVLRALLMLPIRHLQGIQRKIQRGMNCPPLLM